MPTGGASLVLNGSPWVWMYSHRHQTRTHVWPKAPGRASGVAPKRRFFSQIMAKPSPVGPHADGGRVQTQAFAFFLPCTPTQCRRPPALSPGTNSDSNMSPKFCLPPVPSISCPPTPSIPAVPMRSLPSTRPCPTLTHQSTGPQWLGASAVDHFVLKTQTSACTWEHQLAHSSGLYIATPRPC